MKTVKKEAFKVVGLGIRTTNEGGKAVNDLAKLWSNFLSQDVASMIPNRKSDTFYGIYTNYESDHVHPYDAIIGYEVPDFSQVPEGMVTKEMEGGTFEVITVSGDMRQGEPIAQAWQEINEKGLPRAYSNDFEIYDERAANPAQAVVDIYVALK